MQEDWGELNTAKRAPTVFVLDLKRWNVKPVEGLPADSSIGQPEWTPDGMQQFYAFHGFQNNHLVLCQQPQCVL